MRRVHPVILAGGDGRRLWPLSTPQRPKPFLRLPDSGSTLLEDVLARFKSPLFAAPGLVCGETTRFLAAETCRAMGVAPGFIILEPTGRDTAPALTLAALALTRAGVKPGALMLASPADHRMARPDAFIDAVRRAAPCAEDGGLVAFGVQPTRPETEYGYIAIGDEGPGGAARIRKFHEKPDGETAARYLEDPSMLWNGGMFLMRVGTWLSEVERWAPCCLLACRTALRRGRADPDFLRPQADAFRAAAAVSIDRAVMEKTERGCVVRLDAGWNDLGDWSRIARRAFDRGLSEVRRGPVRAQGCCRYLALSDGPPVRLRNVRDHAVIVANGSVLVTSIARLQPGSTDTTKAPRL